MIDDALYDVLVIGGGVVGLAILRAATIKGYKCALVEAEPDLLSWASGSNSGIVCTGVDASPGTLERALIRDSISCIRGFCMDHNIPHRPCGSLVCQWSWDDSTTTSTSTTTTKVTHTLQDVLAESHVAGDTHASMLSSTQVKKMEPNISQECQGAVHIPGEIVVDPWLFSIAYAVHARENGAQIFTNWKFDPLASKYDGTIWTAVRADDGHSSSVSLLSSPSSIKARTIVNACGLWSDVIQATVTNQSTSSDHGQWSARPRRGQYRLFRTNDHTQIQHPIQPIPTQRTKGIFVFGTLYNQIAVGPTALDQESRTDRSVDPAVAVDLASFAKKVIPKLDTERDYVGDYVGIRPGTDKRDFQIHLLSEKRWIAAAGIRSTGLTSSLGIGRHVVQLLDVLLPEPKGKSVIQTTPLPSLSRLIQQYQQRRDGTVDIHGNRYRVTHPVTIFGWNEVIDPNTPESTLYNISSSSGQSKL